jgi:hypothetical protein
MIDNDEVLEVMQADILGILHATPSLKGHVFSDNEGDFNSRLEKSLGTKTVGSTGKRGLAIIVLQVDVVEADKNLPGPPLKIRVRVLVIENIVINRSATKGTLQRSSQAALNILNTLQLASLGSHVIYGEKTPIAPQTVPEGMSSHMVTLFAQSGMNPVSRPLGVTPTFAEGTLVPNALTTAFAGTNNDLIFSQVGTGTAPTVRFVMQSSGVNSVAVTGTAIVVTLRTNFSSFYLTASEIRTLIMASTPAMALVTVELAPGNNGTGAVCQPATADISFGPTALSGGSGSPSSLSLSCASAGSSIRYTTDGSFPSPAKTLYTTPILNLAPGTVVRAAAYLAGMPPGDVLELVITE